MFDIEKYLEKAYKGQLLNSEVVKFVCLKIKE